MAESWSPLCRLPLERFAAVGNLSITQFLAIIVRPALSGSGTRKKRLHWTSGLRQDAHDAQDEEDSPAAAARAVAGTTAKQYASCG